MKPFVVLIIIVFIAGLAWAIITINKPSNLSGPTAPSPTTEITPSPTQGKQSMVSYKSPYGNLQFQYPSGYFLKESDQRTSDKPQYTVVLFEDTQENRDLVEGRNTTPREGPPTITIDIYSNPENLTPDQWVTNNTNWVFPSKVQDTQISGNPAEVYKYDGLYSGKLTITAKDNFVYIFSVGWRDSEDQIVKDYDMVINSVEI